MDIGSYQFGRASKWGKGASMIGGGWVSNKEMGGVSQTAWAGESVGGLLELSTLHNHAHPEDYLTSPDIWRA